MNGLIQMLVEAGVPQVLSWEEFKKPSRRVGWYKELPPDSVETHFYVNTDGLVLRYIFGYQGVYKSVSIVKE
jgi:hypothetical protein